MSTLPYEGVERLAPPRSHFTHLLASNPRRRAPWSSPGAAASLVVHAGVIAALLWANLNGPTDAMAEEEIVTFVEVQPAEVKKEEPKPDEPKPQPVKSDAPILPKGTQALLPPEEPPLEIPEVDLSAPAVSAEDFSGIGVVGGVADGVEGAPLPEAPATETGTAYEVAVLERKPELTNGAAVAAAIERLYPKILKEAGIGGTVSLEFIIETDGTVDVGSVRVAQSPNDLLADASVKAVERFRFRPGRYEGREVRVLIVMPISWVPPSR